MASYIVPPDMKEKEKMVGGVLTMAQFAWLMAGLAIVGLIFLALYELLKLFSLIIAVPIGLIIALPFAFYKKEELSLFRYLYLNKKFKKKKKHLLNSGHGGKK